MSFANEPTELKRSGVVHSGESLLRWDTTTGPAECIVGGVDVGLGYIAPSLWRAPTDNDGVKQGWMSEVSGKRPQWMQWGLDGLSISLDRVERSVTADGRTAITFTRTVHGVEAEASSTTRFIVGASSVQVDESITIPDVWNDLPRVGTRFEITPRFDRLSWFGSGPHETYPDRKSSGLIAVHEGRVGDQYHPYVVPQEHGAHVETRWFKLVDRQGKGLRVSCATPLSFNARFEHDATLAAATTIAEVEQSDTIEVHVDAAVRGLGTAACGPDCLPEFRVGPGEWSWSFTFEAVRSR